MKVIERANETMVEKAHLLALREKMRGEERMRREEQRAYDLTQKGKQQKLDDEKNGVKRNSMDMGGLM